MTNGVQNNVTIPYNYNPVEDSKMLQGSVVTEEGAAEIESNSTSTPNRTDSKRSVNNFRQIIDSINFNSSIEESIAIKGIQNTEEAQNLAYEIKAKIDNIVSKVTSEDVRAIINSNYNPAKVSLDIFENIVDENKVALETNDHAKIESELDKRIQTFSELFDNEERVLEIIKRLNEKNLPTSKQNIGKVYDVLQKSDKVKLISDENVLNLIKNQAELTLSNVYKSSFIPASKEGVSEDINALEEQVAKVLENHSQMTMTGNQKALPSDEFRMDNSKANVELGKQMISAGIELNDDNLFKVEGIKEGIAGINDGKMIDSAIDNIINNKPIGDILLDSNQTIVDNKPQYTQEELEDIVAVIPNIRDEHIQSIIESQQILNIRNLAKEVAKESSVVSVQSVDNQVQKGRLNLEEIRLKMTLEVAGKLNNQGIAIDVEPLENLVDSLRDLEKEGMANLLNTNGVTPTTENINKVQDVFEQVNTIKNMPAQVFEKVVNKDIGFTINEMSTETKAITGSEEALKSYENLGTKPRRDMGDHIEKAFDKMDSLLKELEIEVTAQNERAVTILGRNGMAITDENIQAVSLVDAKVSRITEQLHPTIVVNMIKDNLSPVEMHVDEVLEYMEDYQELYNKTDLDVIAEGIVSMDKDNILTSEERESLVGTYRMLMTISKSKGAAAGFLTKNNMDMNLNNLFEAAKYIKQAARSSETIEVAIDDSFGYLEKVNYQGTTIREQIQSGLSTVHIPPTETNITLAEALIESGVDLTEDNYTSSRLNYEQINKLIDKLSGGLPRNDTSLQDATHEVIDTIKELSQADTVDFEMIQKYNLKTNINEISAAIKLQNNAYEMRDTLNHLMDNLENNDVDTKGLTSIIEGFSNDNFTENYEEHIKDLKEYMTSIMEDVANLEGNVKDEILKDSQLIRNISEVQGAITNEENYYQIPLMLGGEMTQLNMYYVNNNSRSNQSGSEDDMSIYLYFNTNSLGSVQAYVNIKNNAMDFNLFTENTENLEFIQGFGREIANILNETKYNVNGIDYKYYKGESPVNEEASIEVSRKMSSNSDGSFEVII